jgi:hypothetical protein
VSTLIHESFLEGAETDLEAAKAMVKVGLFSQTLYLVEQSLEKSTKSLYAYYLLNYDHMPEEKIYATIKRMGHDNSKTIPEIYTKICEIESASWANIHSPDSRVQNVALQAQQQISILRQKVVDLKDKILKEKSKAPSIESNLIKNFPDEINKIYEKYKNLDRKIEAQSKKALQQLNFTGTENATKPHPFITFFALTYDLIFCMMIRNDIYRYPILERYQNTNLQMLNRPEMKQPCKQLIEIMEACIATIKPLKKGGGLAM